MTISYLVPPPGGEDPKIEQQTPETWDFSDVVYPEDAGASCGALGIAAPFLTSSALYNGTSHYLNLGTSLGFTGATNVAFFMWLRYSATGWTSGSRALLARNASAQRQFTITANARGGTGEIQLGFGNGTTLFNRFVPDNTFSGDYWSPLFVAKTSTTIRAWGGVNLTQITLTGADVIPATLGASTAGIKVGATGTDGAPSNFWSGYLSNVALWTSWSFASDAAFVAAGQALWMQGVAGDLRTIGGSVPSLSAYVPHHVNPPTELIVPITLGGVSPANSAVYPPIRTFVDTLFSRRLLINLGSEPFLASGVGGLGNYSASPSIVRDSTNRILCTYSRGVSHVNGHVGQILRWNTDELATMPLSNRAYPGQSTVWATFPHGTLTNGSKRSFSLSRVSEIGVSGRIFCIYNETDYTMPSVATTAVSVTDGVATALVASTTNFSVGDWIWTAGLTTNRGQSTPTQVTDVVTNTSISYTLDLTDGAFADGVGTITRLSPERRVWIQYSDDDGTTWSTPYDFPGAGTYWNSVGRAKVVRRHDDSLIFGYYYRSVTVEDGIEGRYISAVAQSTDNGVTWSHFSNILISPDATVGMRWEEPYFQYVPKNYGRLMCLVRCDSGSDPRIHNGDALTTGAVVRTYSTDNGLTWSRPVITWEGMNTNSHPLWLYRPSDGLIVATGQHEDPDRSTVIRVSRDFMHSWSDELKVPTTLTGLNMQGDLLLADDDTFLFVWAQEYAFSGSPQATSMWSGKIRDCALSDMSTT